MNLADIEALHTEIQRAARRIKGVAVRTPLLTSAALDTRVGARVVIKAENLQHAGSFKFRGAYNRLSQLAGPERTAGVVAWSSGNHAQGVALAARLLGMPAVIVMPADAPAVKIASTRAMGAEILFYDRYSESREAIGERLATERGATLVPSYDDPHIIAGQGTCGLEIAEQAREAGLTLDTLLVCCGGGGLVAGISAAMRIESPVTRTFSVEPADFDDHARSLVSGQRESNAADARSICDALLAPEPGAMTFAINRQTLAGGLAVSDADVRAAMRFAFAELKLVVEPGGAVALAALLAGKLDVGGQTVGIVISGGNVDPGLFAAIIADG
jgi:threonine dehydratase